MVDLTNISNLTIANPDLRESTRNLLICITPYFTYRLRNSAFSNTASSWMPFIYTIGNLVFLIRAMFAQKNLGFQRVKQNIFWSIGWLGGIILMLLITAEMEYVPPTMFFLLMM